MKYWPNETAALEGVEAEGQREKEALRAFLKREAGETVLKSAWQWLKDRWLWLRYFSWQ